MNGDAKEIVKLLTAKIDDGNRQINQRFDDFKNTIKQYTDVKHQEQQKEIKNQKKLIDNHCPRIRKLESFRWYLLGVGAVLVSLGGLVGIINYLSIK